MILYKFLRKGAIGPYSGFPWPTPIKGIPGEWVDVEGELRLASNAIHACRVDQLPYWLDAELWEIELDGPVEEAERHVFGRRGRLIRRIDGWTKETAVEIARSCAERSRVHAIGVLRAHGVDEQARALGESLGPEGLMASGYRAAGVVPAPLADVVLDAADTGFAVHSGMGACLAAYLAARTARSAANANSGSAEDADRAERRWQARWLADNLSLTAND